MTADELVRHLELERAQLPTADTPERCAQRLELLVREVRAAQLTAKAEYLQPKRRNARRRAHDRARQAAGQ